MQVYFDILALVSIGTCQQRYHVTFPRGSQAALQYEATRKQTKRAGKGYVHSASLCYSPLLLS